MALSHEWPKSLFPLSWREPASESTPAFAVSPMLFRRGLAALGLIAVVFATLRRNLGLDDAYITWRYARNISQGVGWEFNPGDNINAATSPLHVILLALSGGSIGDIPLAAWMLDSICLAAAAMLVALWLRDHGYALAGLCAGFLLITDYFLGTLFGLETPLVLALLSGVLWAYGRGRLHVAATALGFLVLARHDGALLAAILLVFHLVQWRRGNGPRLPWSAMVLFGAVLAPWFLFAWIAFGSPLPNTMSAKIAQGRSMYWGQETMASAVWSTARSVGMMDYVFVAAPFAILGLGFVALRRQSFVLPLLAYTSCHFVAYTLLGINPYRWYYALELYTFVILVGIGLESGLRWARDPIRRVTRARLQPAQANALLIGAAGVWLVVLSCLSWRPPTEFWKAYAVAERDVRETAYLEVGRYLRANTPPSATVAAAEIGALGWTSERPIADYLGLLSSEAAERLEQNDVTWWVNDLAPDYIVFHVPYWPIEQPSRASPELAQNYQLMATLKFPDYADIEIWQRVDANSVPSSG